MNKTERGYETRKSILRYLKRHKQASPKSLALYLHESSYVVRGHLAIMAGRGEIERLDNGAYAPRASKTAAPQAKKATRIVNLCANKKAIPSQGGQGSAGPRVQLRYGVFGL